MKYNLGDSCYGLDLTGLTDSTSAMQAAMATIPAGSKIYLPSKGPGILLSQTITVPPCCEMSGDGQDYIGIQRTTDYGDTLNVGDEVSVPAGGFRLVDMAIVHGSTINAGQTLTNKATKGAHIRLHGSQRAHIENCRLWRMPYGVYFHGGSLMYLERNNFLGYWDDQNASNQEGIAYVCYDVSSKWGNPQLANHVHNYFGGLAVTRSVTYDGIVKSLPAAVGTQYGVLIYGMEVASIIGDYYGAVNQNSIAYRAKAGGYIAQHKIAECDFDASGQDNIFVQSTDGATAIYDISITNNTFTGEDCCPHAVFIQTVNGQYGGAPSIYGLNFDGNTVRDHMGSGLRTLGTVVALSS